MRDDTRKSALRLAVAMAHMAASVMACAVMALATTRIISRIATGCPPCVAIPTCAFVVMVFLAAMVPMVAAMTVTARSAKETLGWTRRSRTDA